MGLADRPRAPKIAGYSSWYNRYEDIDEATIREDLDGCQKILRPGDLFQIDDGWEKAVGDWLATDPAKFPEGLAPLVDEIHRRGYEAGLWLAPFVAEKESALVHEHPEWLLRVPNADSHKAKGEFAGVVCDGRGEPWECGGNWSGYYALDINNSEVIDYLRDVFDLVLRKWGFDLVKLDFLYGAAPFGTAHESRAARMRRAMRLLRELCGQKLILGCGVPVAPAFGLVDYCRVGCDMTLDWDDGWYMQLFHRERSSCAHSISNTLVRRQLSGRAHGNDPDVFFLREKNLKLAGWQKEELATVNALLGDVFLTSDNPSDYGPQTLRRYEELRDIFENRQNVIVDLDTQTIAYELHGKTHEVKLRW